MGFVAVLGGVLLVNLPGTVGLRAVRPSTGQILVKEKEGEKQ
jgi:hypothetical protein